MRQGFLTFDDEWELWGAFDWNGEGKRIQLRMAGDRIMVVLAGGAYRSVAIQAFDVDLSGRWRAAVHGGARELPRQAQIIH